MVRDLEGSMKSLPPDDDGFNAIVSSRITSADFPLESREKFFGEVEPLTRESLLNRMKIGEQALGQNGKTKEAAQVNSLILHLNDLHENQINMNVLLEVQKEFERIDASSPDTED